MTRRKTEPKLDHSDQVIDTPAPTDEVDKATFETMREVWEEEQREES